MLFKRYIPLIFIFACLVEVPHPYCYYLYSKEDKGSEIVVQYKKNSFFPDCDKVTMSPLAIDKPKDITIYLDGEIYKEIKKQDICKDIK